MGLVRGWVLRVTCGLAVSLWSVLTMAQAVASFTQEELDQMLAPIALYPDTLLSQVLMASTYPAEVAEAAKWSKANPDKTGDAAVKAVESQTWDPSVKSLVAFPQVLTTMGAQPDWVQRLGDAFLASSQQVLDAAQRLRSRAEKAGHLKTTEGQKVVKEQAPQAEQTVIRIEQADPQVVYVPAYDPGVVYGAWPYPAYPPFYYPPPVAYYPGAVLASGLVFGVGVAATAALWGDCDWGRGDVDINVNKYNNINANRKLDAQQTRFQHNTTHRRGVPYGDDSSRQRFAGAGAGDASQRTSYRGRDPQRDAQRQQAQATLQERNMEPGGRREPSPRDASGAGATEGLGRERPDQADARGRGDQPSSARQGTDNAGARARPEAGGDADHAFRGAADPGRSREQAHRGEASRSSMTQQGPRGAGGRASAGVGGGRRR
ncbi:DUF3300 domain-containing protein [Caldimonas brevitalea]|uniref:Membrane protein n=1 Tax=Caldimonas brevitalea TaxID=413882 RepID=A0A0G3BMY2_9BURK|nr:DUF3300 domain-containing protein [Caldimonas brevitalea]AKJ29328.1 membrane protein [Caldimonas brevitalea]